MINIIIKDGLGNQMFQYAFARLMQEEYKRIGKSETIAINPYYVENVHLDGYDERKMALHNLVLSDSVTVVNSCKVKWQMYIFFIRTLLSSGFAEIIRWRFLKKYNSTDRLAERRGKWGIYYPYGPYTDHPITLSKFKNKYIFGFFQNSYYCNRIKTILKKELLVKTSPSNENAKKIEEIKSCNAVCLHIRRGDYLNPQWKQLQICDFEYYNRAINEILSRCKNPVFYVFSNNNEEIKWIKDNYHFTSLDNKIIEIKYVELNNPDYEELRLMYSCRHFIISNSTFSWWAAWLADDTGKIVIAPSRWNLDEDSDYKIYDNSWIKI